LAIVVIAIAGAGLVVTDLIAITQVRAVLVRQVDQDLVSAASGPVLRLNEFNGDADDGLASRPRRIPTSMSLSILNANGSLVAQYGGDLGAQTVLPDVAGLTLKEVVALEGEPFTINGPSGHFRALGRVVVGGQTTVIIAQSLLAVATTLFQISLLLLLISLIVLITLGLLARSIVGLGLKPLRSVEDTAEAIAAGDFSARVDEFDPRTEVGRLTAALNTMLARVEESFTAKAESEAQLRRFVADASHELRTPLTAIRGFSEMAQKGMVSPEEASQRIEKESLRMTSLVEDLLLLARLDQAPTLEIRPVDVRTLLDEAVEEASTIHPTHVFELQLPQEEVIVDADGPRLHRVITNLLRNAGLHTPAGTKVRTALAIQGNLVRISVADDGPGIAPEHLARIFERFYRADAARARHEVVSGSGLGLAIVKSIVEAHGGRVSVRSDASQGTEFVLTLPLQHQ
jgi:two-component system OmpR family sensor kinase